jgi:hypothetical protein
MVYHLVDLERSCKILCCLLLYYASIISLNIYLLLTSFVLANWQVIIILLVLSKPIVFKFVLLLMSHLSSLYIVSFVRRVKYMISI